MTYSEWAAPIVPVVKRDGNVRICGDYKLTVNAVSKTDPYPLPRIEDIFASLSGGKTFTNLDLEHAYQQVPLTEEAQKYTTVNTHKGLFQYCRLYTLWHRLCSRDFPAYYGDHPAGPPPRMCVSR